MKGILQYSSLVGGPFKNAGTIRTNTKSYTLTPVTDKNIIGEPRQTAFNVKAEANVLSLNSDFLTADSWYFRIYFPTELKEIALGSRNYLVSYDAKTDLPGIEIFKINLDFLVSVAALNSYITPANLPGGDSSAFIESSDLYYIE